jgi:hypothetical protein
MKPIVGQLLDPIIYQAELITMIIKKTKNLTIICITMVLIF